MLKIYETHGNDIESVAEEMKPCKYYATQYYEKFIVRELLNRVLSDLSESEELDNVLSENE